jgi:hypothetical protein
MSEYGHLGIFDHILEVKPGPISTMDENGIAIPATVEVALSISDTSTVLRFVLPSEIARRLAKLLSAHTPR